MDDADGTFISKTKFLEQWRDKPAMITEPYNIDTEENVIHFLARFSWMINIEWEFYLNNREGKLDVLRELCLDNKGNNFVVEGLKARDKFGQTPVLSAILASENRSGIYMEILFFICHFNFRNEILKFLLNLILEKDSDSELQEITILR